MMIEEQMIRKIKEYDAEISEIYNKKDEMETELKDLRCKQLSRSDLLSKYVWIFDDGYCRDNKYISLRANTHYWKELEEAAGISSYHWRIPIEKNELYVSGDDGDIYLHINSDVFGKWVKHLNLKIDIKLINQEIEEMKDDITSKETKIKFLEEIKSLME